MIKITPIKSSHRSRNRRERSRSPITRSMKRLGSPIPGIYRSANRLLSPISRLDSKDMVQVKRSPMKGRVKRTPTKPKHTNYFTLSEDAVIIDVIKNNRQTSLNELAGRISRPLDSLKSRISKYLIKLSESDLKAIIDSAKTTPFWHAHFIPDGTEGKKLGGIVQNLDKHHEPPSTAATLLTKRSPMSKQTRLVKKKRNAMFPDNKENCINNVDLLVINTPAKPFKANKDLNSGSCTPELIYMSKSHNGTTALIDPTHIKILPVSVFEQFEQKKKCSKDWKISTFMSHLASKRPEHLHSNAEVLVEILKSFSISFNVDLEEIFNIISKSNKGAVNLQGIRNSLMENTIQK